MSRETVEQQCWKEGFADVFLSDYSLLQETIKTSVLGEVMTQQFTLPTIYNYLCAYNHLIKKNMSTKCV